MVHLSGFKRAVEETYGFKPFYRAYIEERRGQAVFPGFFHTSRVYGRKILSQPFSEYGGILLAAGLAPAERASSWTSSPRRRVERSGSSRFAHLEMRNPVSLGGESADYFSGCAAFQTCRPTARRRRRRCGRALTPKTEISSRKHATTA